MAENKDLVPVVVKELRPHAIWALITRIGSLAGAAMIAALSALFQKMLHGSLDWLFIGGLFLLSIGVLALLLYLANKLSREHTKQHGLIIGLTTDDVELEPAPQLGYKFKLRLYWTNDGDEKLHIGKPAWKPLGMGIQGRQLAYSFQLPGIGKPWGEETKETDVLAGQQCRIWLGLDPTSGEIAEQLLEKGRLGTLVLPVTMAGGAVELRIRPRKLRGL